MEPLPLGLLTDPGNKELVEQLSALERYDFAEVTRQCIEKYGWSEDHAKSIETQTKQFLSLAFLDQDQYHIPESDIDEYWHRMILNTAWYEIFSNDVFGAYYHHTPVPDPRFVDDGIRVRSKGIVAYWYGNKWKELVKTCTQCRGPKTNAKERFEKLKPAPERLPNIKEITKDIKP